MFVRFPLVQVFVLIVVTILSIPFSGTAQENVVSIDTTKLEQPLKGDTLAIAIPLAQDSTKNTQDTVAKKKDGLEDLVHATAKDSIIYAIDGRKVYLHNTAKVLYQDLQIEAGYIVIDYITQEMFACGIPDSTGTKIVQTPKFKEGSEEYEMETINYNFATKKAKISTVITQQGEGYLHSAQTKLMPDRSVNIGGGKYTTCDHEHPHFYLNMTKAKMVPDPNSKIVFGFSYLVIEDVPTPLFVPFGFFPKMSDRASGLLFPTFGEESNRGFFLRNIGYYFVLGEYADFATTLDYYTLGSWASHNIVRYKKRYRYDGNLNFNITNNVVGDKGSVDYFKSGDFQLAWSHQQAQQANPTTQFAASVNISSPSYSTLNGQTMNQHLAPSSSSTVRYSKNWEDSPFSMSMNLTHRQQMTDSSYALGLPSLTFDVGKFAPFKRKGGIGKEKYYEKFRLSYGMQFENSINFKSKDWGKPDFYDKFDNGAGHKFGIDLPSMTLLKYINVSPSVSYGMNWHFRSTREVWNNTTNSIDYFTSGSFSEFAITQQYSGGLSLNTTMYGLMQFKGDPLIKAVRHVFKPNIGLSYAPDLQNHANGWREVQSDEKGAKLKRYNIYSGQKFAALGGSESASMSINLGNSLEFKLRNRKDTTSTNSSIKLKLLESFNISTNYNFLADSMKLANISFNGRTNILDKVGLSFNFTVDPYDINEKGQRIDKYYWARRGGLNFGRLTNFSTSFGYSISGGKGKAVETTQSPHPKEGTDYFSPHNTIYYVDFNVPWTFGFDVNYSMTKSYSYNEVQKELTKQTNNIITLNFRGSVSPTKNWMLSFTSGYDFDAGEISNTQVSIHRDLHCFEFNFSWIPIGRYKSWNFGINVKSSTLRDLLKYDKRSSWFDNYFNNNNR